MLKKGDTVWAKDNGEWVLTEVRNDQYEGKDEITLRYYPEHPIQGFRPIAKVITRKLKDVYDEKPSSEE